METVGNGIFLHKDYQRLVLGLTLLNDHAITGPEFDWFSLFVASLDIKLVSVDWRHG